MGGCSTQQQERVVDKSLGVVSRRGGVCSWRRFAIRNWPIKVKRRLSYDLLLKINLRL